VLVGEHLHGFSIIILVRYEHMCRYGEHMVNIENR
jgi:hypothetical protein